MTGLIWFRRDLRLDDNPAWSAATSNHDALIALFVIDPLLWEGSGTHRRVQLRAHLEALDKALAEQGGRLKVRRGRPVDVVAEEAGPAAAIYWNDDYSPYATKRDEAVAATVDIPVHRFHGNAVHSPAEIFTDSGTPYRVFTPYYKRWTAEPWSPPESPDPARIGDDPGEGLPAIEGDPLLAPGEDAAFARLEDFLDRIDEYDEQRNRPDLDRTSRLSADLKFGTLGPRRIIETAGDASKGRRAFVRQLCWRDFYAQIMFHSPHTAVRAMRPEYDRVAWRDDSEGFAAWQAGATGYPIVDAGMRQLQAEGWMHNRVRMIAASFLVKDLLIDWRRGERHFRDVLVDADLAQNVGNWQWVAGTGADAAPYFRVFNPIAQGRKFDPNGDYVRRYVPELAGLDTRYLHAPWEAGPLDLAAAGIDLGGTYPEPIIDHAFARERVLAAYQEAREHPERDAAP